MLLSGARRLSVTGDQTTAGIGHPEWGSTVICVATILRTECPLWVRNEHFGAFNSCPLFPRKQTSLSAAGTSAKCQQRTYARDKPLSRMHPRALGDLVNKLFIFPQSQADDVHRFRAILLHGSAVGGVLT